MLTEGSILLKKIIQKLICFIIKLEWMLQMGQFDQLNYKFSKFYNNRNYTN